jgi:serine/threonine protein kinase
LLENFKVLGDRVLGGTQDGNPKVLKFFGSIEAAEKAMERQTELKDCIGKSPGMQLCKGCGARNALCAVLYDKVQSQRHIEHSHLKDLTEKVAAIYAKGFVHGDLRPQNILPCADGTVTLIDLEWAGRHGAAEFPLNLNIKAFGEKARRTANPQEKIDPKFDWLCLADIFLRVGCDYAALAALRMDKKEVVAALDAHRRLPQSIDFSEALGYLESPPKFLNLSALDQRVSNYYKAVGRGHQEPSSSEEPMSTGGGQARAGARKRARESFGDE